MTTETTDLRVDGARLIAALDSLARIGAAASGGVNRPAYSDADLEAREAVRSMMRATGLDVRVDAAGNTFGARDGTLTDAAPLVIGSHTDTVPEGGRFDGALGVLAAIEVARTLAERGVTLAHPLEVVDFQNEEGGLIGSKIVAGRFAPDALDLVATSGFTLGDGIARLGGDPAHLDRAVRAPGSIAGYLELHIEQGRELERASADIGVVEGLVGIRYWEVVFEGAAAHAGTTPMADRRDALLAAARFVDAVHAVVTSMPGRHVGTVGRLSVFPGGANVVPGRVALTLELRDLDARTIDALFERVATEGDRIARETRTSFAATPTLTAAPSPMHADARRAIADSAAALGLRTRDLPSGAGHDAQNMAALGPAGMIFVPSVDGISHSPAERTEDHDIVNGANVLLGALLRLDESA
jgi:N-carbamoyl-L-amino-acid hydrolase